MDEMDGLIERPLRAMYRRAMLGGWTMAEAGNLVAWRHHLRPSDADPWTWQEVARVEFLRWLADHERIGGPEH